MPNAKVLEEKQAIVSEVKERLQNYVCSIVADYRGLNVAEVTRLRRQLSEAGVEFKVLKNRLVKRATAEIDMTGLDEYLVGPTAFAFSKDDPVAPAKILLKFAKENENLKLKAGVVEGKVVTVDQLKELADLPSREGLLSMLLSVLQSPMQKLTNLQSPIRNLAYALKAVADQKS
jgi:large subunit ribosomal protein L10